MSDSTTVVIPDELYAHHRDRFRWASRLVETYLEPKNLRCLDLGCGSGNMLLALKKFGAAAVTGLDIDLNFMGPASMYRLAEELGISLDGCERLQGEITSMPADARWDLIAMYDVFEHVTTPLETLANCRQRLPLGGTLFLSTSPLYYSPVGHHCWHLFPRATQPWAHLYEADAARKIQDDNPWHGKVFSELNKATAPQILALLDETGFTVDRVDIFRAPETLDGNPHRDTILRNAPSEEDLYLEAINLVARAR
jgi:2-polyprenyl-3-methyl-5-hydroxy-6-metoxy-1,4-benzoquinol methylase